MPLNSYFDTFMKIIRSTLFVALMAFLATSCKDKVQEVTPGDGTAETANPDWTTESHSGDGSPNYDIVFPQSQVNTLEITMTAADWTAIKTDMQTLTGTAFGTRSSGSQGGGGIPGGNPPNGGNGGGLDLIGGDPIYVTTTLKFNGKTWNKVGLRLKGNSSLSSIWGRVFINFLFVSSLMNLRTNILRLTTSVYTVLKNCRCRLRMLTTQ